MSSLRTKMKAWVKVLNGTTDAEHIRRSKICSGCEYAKHKKYLDFIDDDMKEVKGFVCDLCGCPLSAKIRSTDICYKWKQDTNS